MEAESVVVYAFVDKPVEIFWITRNGAIVRTECVVMDQAEPEPPHVREDYREVWLSGWRAAMGTSEPR